MLYVDVWLCTGTIVLILLYILFSRVCSFSQQTSFYIHLNMSDTASSNFAGVQDSEISSLKEEFGKECKIIKDVGEFHYVVSIRPSTVDVVFKFQLSGMGY